MKIGIYGGTFDPFHTGHLITAELTLEKLSLDKILIIPAFVPPHKQHQPITSYPHRLEMARLAAAGNKQLSVSDIESRLGKVSYTLNTLLAIKKESPADAEFFLILGADSLLELHTWHKPDALLETCRVAILPRLECDISGVSQAYLKKCDLLDTPVLEIASSDLRNRIREGKSIRYQVPDPVIEYIRTHRLYQNVS